MSDESKGMILGFIAVTAFGLTLPATRFIIPYFDPVFIGLGRAVIAAITAAILLFVTHQPLPEKQQFKQLLIVAFGVVAGFPVLSAWAMQTVPAAHGGVVLGILPLATALVGALITREKPSIGFWISASMGSGLVVAYALLNGDGSIHWGDLALLGAIISAAAGYAVGGQLATTLGSWQVICWALVISLPFIILPVWVTAPNHIQHIPLSTWMGFLYLALVSQLFGFFLWYRGLALGGIVRVSQTQLLQPFITLIAAGLWMHETIDALTLIFALLVVTCVAIGKRMPIHKKTLI